MPGFENWGYPMITGDAEFNAYARQTKILWSGFYGPLEHGGSGNASAGPVQSWLSDPRRHPAPVLWALELPEGDRVGMTGTSG